MLKCLKAKNKLSLNRIIWFLYKKKCTCAGTDQSTHLRGYVHLLPEEIKISFCTEFIIVSFFRP